MMLPAKQLAAAVTTVTQVQELKQVVKSSLWLGCSQCSYSVFCSNEGHLYRKREYQIRVLVAGYVIPSKFYTLQNWRHIFFSVRKHASWVKFMKSSTSGTVTFAWRSLDRPTRSIRLLQTDRTFEDRFRDKRRSSHATNQTKKLKIWMIMYI